MFSYGSGLASGMFLLRVNTDPSFMREKMNIDEKLKNRVKIPVEEYDKIMESRQIRFGKKSFIPNVLNQY